MKLTVNEIKLRKLVESKLKEFYFENWDVFKGSIRFISEDTYLENIQELEADPVEYISNQFCESINFALIHESNINPKIVKTKKVFIAEIVLNGNYCSYKKGDSILIPIRTISAYHAEEIVNNRLVGSEFPPYTLNKIIECDNNGFFKPVLFL